ncbi:hypothetical protein GW17_00049141 [Ensete ventricosum]|nr:hypothetical protein GW17_00049141 [Ensete ventricosum]
MASPHVGPTTHDQAAAKTPLQGGDRLRPGSARKGGQRHPQGAAPAGTTACSATPARGVDCRTPARGCRQQGQRRRLQRWSPFGRAIVGEHRKQPERRSGSVEAIVGPTMPWREIMSHGDATIRRNR